MSTNLFPEMTYNKKDDSNIQHGSAVNVVIDARSRRTLENMVENRTSIVDLCLFCLTCQ